MGQILSIVAFALLGLSAVLGVVLFFVLVFKRKANKNLDLFARNGRQNLDGEEANHFSLIKHDDASNMIVLKQSGSFANCVVTLITSSNGKKKAKRYKLSFTPEQTVCGIKLNETIEEFRVVLESVDKKLIKHKSADTLLKSTIIYSLIVGVTYIAAIAMYVMMCSYFLVDYWANYFVYYFLSAAGLIFPALCIGGYFLFESLSRKGAF